MSDLGRVLSGKPFVSNNANNIPVNAKLRDQFVFYLAVLKNYVKHAHEIENLNKAQVLEQINPIVNSLIEQYRFGSKFVAEINRYVDSRYHTTPATMYNSIRKDSTLDEGVFGTMMEDFKESKIIDNFSPQFRMIVG